MPSILDNMIKKEHKDAFIWWMWAGAGLSFVFYGGIIILLYV